MDVRSKIEANAHFAAQATGEPVWFWIQILEWRVKNNLTIDVEET